ncbi:MAG: response regulator, partial [bacterium]
ILEDANFRNIEMASNHTEVMEMLKLKRPDLIFLNVRMENNEGNRILRMFRNERELRTIPVLVSVGPTSAARNYEEAFEEAAILKHGKYLEQPRTRQSFISLVQHMLTLRSDSLKEPAAVPIESYCPSKI